MIYFQKRAFSFGAAAGVVSGRQERKKEKERKEKRTTVSVPQERFKNHRATEVLFGTADPQE